MKEPWSMATGDVQAGIITAALLIALHGAVLILAVQIFHKNAGVRSLVARYRVWSTWNFPVLKDLWLDECVQI